MTNQMIVLTGDGEVLDLLKQAGVEPPPEKQGEQLPSNVAIVRFQHEQKDWLVMAHYVPGDEGLVAWGIPLSMSEPDRSQRFAALLASCALRDMIHRLPGLACAMHGNPMNN